MYLLLKGSDIFLIFEKLFSLFLSLPFFKNLEISDGVVNSLSSMISFIAQANQIVNLGALIGVVVTVLSMQVIVAVLRVIIDLL